MKKIPLTQGYLALVDDADFSMLSKFKWRVMTNRRSSIKYAINTSNGLMHRKILRVTDSKIEVDHIDHDGLNNQRANLRVATHAENQHNYRKTSKKTSSRFKGVYWSASRWRAAIKVKGKKIRLGGFITEEMAARAYNEAAKHYFGEFAYLN